MSIWHRIKSMTFIGDYGSQWNLWQMSIVLILTLNLSPYDLGSNDLKFENLNKNQQLSRERTSKLNLEFKIRLAILQARLIFKSYISYIFIEFLTLECKNSFNSWVNKWCFRRMFPWHATGSKYTQKCTHKDPPTTCVTKYLNFIR